MGTRGSTGQIDECMKRILARLACEMQMIKNALDSARSGKQVADGAMDIRQNGEVSDYNIAKNKTYD